MTKPYKLTEEEFNLINSTNESIKLLNQQLQGMFAIIAAQQHITNPTFDFATGELKERENGERK